MDFGDDEPPEDEDDLPEGVQKEVINDGEGVKRPKAGDEVTVHYVGTLASDGSEFDSSRSRDEPFVFTLGNGDVIKGWDVGVASMRKGELAKFTLSPEYGYGEDGSPPTIPANATLVFEVELLSWFSKDDLFQDEGVIKTELKEGDGWRSPADGDEVHLALKCTAKDGSVVEDKPAIDYVIGSGAFGLLSKVVDKALLEMKKGEEAELACKSEYVLGDKTPDGATIMLTLNQIYETKDVSWKKDATLMKKRIVEGEGYDTPKEAYKVKLSVEETEAGSLPGFQAKTLEFTVGNGDVCDALELTILEMKEGEKAVMTCTTPQICLEEQLGLKSISAEKVLLTLELLEFEKGKDTWQMAEDEKLEFGMARKDLGSTLFRKGRYMLALGRYKKIVQLFNYIDSMTEENKVKAKDLKKTCNLNSAMVQLKLKDFAEAKITCDEVLKEDARNVKGLFRRAQANIGLKNFLDSMNDLKKLVAVDPQNKEARALYKEAQAGQKEEDKKSKGLFANMCKALGKGSASQDGSVEDGSAVQDASVSGAEEVPSQDPSIDPG